MLIDRSHRGWAIWTAALFLISTALYVVYAARWPGGPAGRTWPGMMFGVAGTLLMVFAGLLAVRKKTVRWRAGSLSWWLKGHLWLGTLSVPLIFYHASFRWGGTLEVLLWWTMGMVIVSGFVGLALQNVLPRMMQLQLPSEAIPDQFAEVSRRLIAACDAQVQSGCGSAAIEAALVRGSNDTPPAISNSQVWLADFYVNSVRPFLGREQPADSPFSTAQKSNATFDRVGDSLPHDCSPTLDVLRQACAERRRIAQQERYFRILHGWLKIHVPCSVVMLVFTVIHIVSALYY